MRDLCAAAVAAATAAGAEYADARVVLKREQLVASKNGRVDRMADAESEGIGVRVLVNGAWGFACDRRLTDAGAENAATRACTFARAAAGRHSRALAPVEPRQGRHESSVARDPFAVPLADKVELCLRADAALQGEDVVVRQVMVRARREHKLLLSSEGTEVEQILTECGAGMDCAASRDGVFQLRSYPSAHIGSSCQSGWEYVDGLRLVDEAPRVAEQAAALVRADPCPSGVTDVVLDGDQVALQLAVGGLAEDVERGAAKAAHFGQDPERPNHPAAEIALARPSQGVGQVCRLVTPPTLRLAAGNGFDAVTSEGLVELTEKVSLTEKG